MANAIAKFLKRIVGLEPRPWPDGVPYKVGNVRIGTIRPDGSIIYAPGVHIEFAPICSRCQQAIEAKGDQRQAQRVEKES